MKNDSNFWEVEVEKVIFGQIDDETYIVPTVTRAEISVGTTMTYIPYDTWVEIAKYILQVNICDFIDGVLLCVCDNINDTFFP